MNKIWSNHKFKWNMNCSSFIQWFSFILTSFSNTKIVILYIIHILQCIEMSCIKEIVSVYRFNCEKKYSKHLRSLGPWLRSHHWESPGTCWRILKNANFIYFYTHFLFLLWDAWLYTSYIYGDLHYQNPNECNLFIATF